MSTVFVLYVWMCVIVWVWGGESGAEASLRPVGLLFFPFSQAIFYERPVSHKHNEYGVATCYNSIIFPSLESEYLYNSSAAVKQNLQI